MLQRNIDFFAVLFITWVMLGLNWVHSSHWQEAMDSVRVVPAIRIDSCPFSSDILSRLTCILPH
jgi:hypothetical protein